MRDTILTEEQMEELVLRAQAGDETSYFELISIIQSDLYQIAKARLNNHEDVNDVLQQTVIYAYRNIKQLHEPKYFKTWIIKILINECNKMYNQNCKKATIFNKLLNRDKNKSDIVDHFENIDNKLDLEKILDSLNFDERICIVLFYNSGYSASEIADILCSNENTIRSRIARAKEKIRKQYQKGGAVNGFSKK